MPSCLQSVPSQAYFAVFDGHAGVDAAVYSASHLHTNLVRHPAFLTDLPTAIRDTFHRTDDNFLNKAKQEVCVCVLGPWVGVGRGGGDFMFLNREFISKYCM